MKKIIIIFPFLWVSCFIPSTEKVSINFPEIPEPWNAFWTGSWDVRITDGVEILEFLGEKGSGLSVDLPCARQWIVLVTPGIWCQAPPPNAAAAADSTCEQVYPLWSAGPGTEILLRQEVPDLVQSLNLSRFFDSLNRLSDPLSVNAERISSALGDGSVNFYSFTQSTLFPLVGVFPAGQWKAGNWYHPMSSVLSQGLCEGLHWFFDLDAKRILLINMHEGGKQQDFLEFPEL